jgi:hypothetical protein
LSGTTGLTPAELSTERSKEVAMQRVDAEIVELLGAKNQLESFILEVSV